MKYNELKIIDCLLVVVIQKKINWQTTIKIIIIKKYLYFDPSLFNFLCFHFTSYYILAKGQTINSSQINGGVNDRNPGKFSNSYAPV